LDNDSRGADIKEKKLNCWEITNCGRGPGASDTARLGICPAATDASCDGLNGGHNGGRVCWAVAGSLCGGIVRGTFAAKYRHCLGCEVYQRVRNEESGWGFVLLKPGQMLELREFLARKRSIKQQLDLEAQAIPSCTAVVCRPAS
jgi:hypothetical protein